MFDEVITGLKPYLEVGFLDEITSAEKIGPNAIMVRAGKDQAVVNVTADGIEAFSGDNRGTVLSGISPDQAVRFIIQALGRADFDVPPVIVARFQREAYPQKIEQAVLAPVGVTEGRKPGTFSAVYKDAHGKFYIHQDDEARVSLKFFHALYDKGSEHEFLGFLPGLYKTDTPPVLAKSFSFASEDLASEVLGKAKIASFHETVAKGIPLRVASSAVPATGVLRVAGVEYPAKELGERMQALSQGWEAALSGKAPAKPEALVFSSVRASLGRVSQTSHRAEVILEFMAPVPLATATAADGVFVDTHKVILSKSDAMRVFEDLDDDFMTSDGAVVSKLTELAKRGIPVKSAKLEALPGAKVASMVTSAITAPNLKSFLVSSVADGKETKQPVEEFLKQNAFPEWLGGCSVFSALRIKQ